MPADRLRKADHRLAIAATDVDTEPAVAQVEAAGADNGVVVGLAIEVVVAIPTVEVVAAASAAELVVAGFAELGYAKRRSAPVAQLDRALPSEGKGHTFESCRVRQILPNLP